MHLQTAFRQARLKFRLEGLRLLLAPAVHQSIVSIPTPWEIRMCPCHPEVERVVKKEISQNWADYGLNAKDNFEFTRIVPYRQQRKEQSLEKALDS
jgi:hypothetical protein